MAKPLRASNQNPSRHVRKYCNSRSTELWKTRDEKVGACSQENLAAPRCRREGRRGLEAVNNAQDTAEGYFCSSQCKEELECPAQNKPRLGSWGPQINLLAGVTWGQGEFMEDGGRQLLARKSLNADYGHWGGSFWKWLGLRQGLFND